MTFEELKVEAEKQGYNLIKKPKRLGRLKHCTCGRYPVRIYGKSDSIYFKCPGCGKKAPVIIRESYETMHGTEKRARVAWDDMITREENNIK